MMSYPVALPFALLSTNVFACKSHTSDETVATTDSLSCRTIMRASSRAGRRTVKRLRESLTQRELAVMRSIELYRYLTARQIEALHFYDHASPLTGARTCRRVLERLSSAGVLLRLERRVGGVRAGSASYVYGLGSLGHHVLHQGDAARARRREPSSTFLDHTLVISQLAVDLQTAARSGELALIALDPEPYCWRTYQRGLEGIETLRPDLAVALRVEGYEYHWFVEIDLATHSSASVVRKCRTYHDYWSTGLEQDKHGVFPKVLWVAPTARRVEQLQRAISGAHSLNHDLFDVTTSSDARQYLMGVRP
jgi:hypothetical protein